jgi:hypothetical protein
MIRCLEGTRLGTLYHHIIKSCSFIKKTSVFASKAIKHTQMQAQVYFIVTAYTIIEMDVQRVTDVSL